tara:strand:- start:14 stop:259 length:246 start_codon:yes stop_codon:yes gene_type:complete
MEDLLARNAGTGRKTARNGRFGGSKFGATARSKGKEEQELAARPYVKPWNQVAISPPYEGLIGPDEQPQTKLDATDYEKRL